MSDVAVLRTRHATLVRSTRASDSEISPTVVSQVCVLPALPVHLVTDEPDVVSQLLWVIGCLAEVEPRWANLTTSLALRPDMRDTISRLKY